MSVTDDDTVTGGVSSKLMSVTGIGRTRDSDKRGESPEDGRVDSRSDLRAIFGFRTAFDLDDAALATRGLGEGLSSRDVARSRDASSSTRRVKASCPKGNGIIVDGVVLSIIAEGNS